MEKMYENMKAIQPYFVTVTSHYKKSVYMKHGIAHFYEYCQDSGNQAGVIAVPDGCVDILFEKDGNQVKGRIAGSVLEQTILNNKDNKEYFGVRFLPGVMPVLLEVSMKELIQAEIPIEDAMADKELAKRLSDIRTAEEWIPVFLHGYQEDLAKEERISPYQSQKELAMFVKKRLLETGGQITIQELAEATCYTGRYIHQCFQDYIGMSPKVFGKIVKFQNAIQMLNQDREMNLAELCISAGYYDQSHFNKDFKKYAAMSPRQYRKLIQDVDYEHRMEIRQITGT